MTRNQKRRQILANLSPCAVGDDFGNLVKLLFMSLTE